MNQRPTVLVTGDFEADVFQFVLQNDTRLKYSRLSDVTQNSDVKNNFDGQPDLVVVCQARRGSIACADSEQLIEQFPLSMRVVLLGSYCEGERRSGQPLEGWHRRFWHQWPAFWGVLEKVFQDQLDHPFRLPATATDGDLLFRYNALAEQVLAAQYRICVDCRWRSEQQWFNDLFEHHGCRIVPLSEKDQADAILVVRDSFDVSSQHVVGQLKLELPSKPIVLTLNFPRIQEFCQAAKMGIAAVIARPFVNLELLYSVEQSISGNLVVSE